MEKRLRLEKHHWRHCLRPPSTTIGITGLHTALAFTNICRCARTSAPTRSLRQRRHVPPRKCSTGSTRPWVQDALDAIEYANGPTRAAMARRRAKNGHPAPFNLKYMEIGNENGGAGYNERWPRVLQSDQGEIFPNMTSSLPTVWLGLIRKMYAPRFVDEHYYDSAEFFMSRAGQYDSYDRKGPKVYIGEYAVTHGTAARATCARPLVRQHS